MNWLITRRTGSAATLFVVVTIASWAAMAAIPESINYQAYLVDPSGAPIDNTVEIQFNLYAVASGGSPIWAETKTVEVAQGLFSVDLGADPFNRFPVDAFDTPLWLGLTVAGESEMTPRRLLSSVGYAFKADDANALQGYSAGMLNQSAHLSDSSNPHGVTAGQTGAVYSSTFNGHAANASAHHVKTGAFTELSGQADDAQIPASIARVAELTWNNLTGIPTGFDDGVDDGVTAVTAGLGLDGGGNSGDVTVSVEVPLLLSGPGSAAIVSGINLSDGYGVYGSSYSSPGIHGFSHFDVGVYGTNGDNYGYLGGPDYGVYGTSISNHAAFFEGSALVTDDLLIGAAGSLGIGLTDPNRKLYVVNRTPGMDYALKLDNPQVGIGSTGIGILFSTEGDGGTFSPLRGKGGLAYVSSGTWNRGAFHVLQDSGANANNPDFADSVMTITNDGDVGIGTTLPATALDVRRSGNAYVTVDGGSTGLSGYRIDENDAGRWLLFFRQWQNDNLHVRDEVAGIDTMTFESGTGRVGIGTGTPQAKLDVAGDLRVAGNITWPSRQDFYSLTSADFGPENSSYDYYNFGSSLVFRGHWTPLPFYRFFAPVNLPHDATVTKVISYWTDQSSNDCLLRLMRVRHSDQDHTEMALMVTSFNESNVRLTYDGTIADPVIDNQSYAYYMELYFYPGTENDIDFHTVRIEYNTTGY